MTGGPCQKWINKKLYLKNVGLVSRRDEVSQALVAAAVGYLIPKIHTSRIAT